MKKKKEFSRPSNYVKICVHKISLESTTILSERLTVCIDYGHFLNAVCPCHLLHVKCLAQLLFQNYF